MVNSHGYKWFTMVTDGFWLVNHDSWLVVKPGEMGCHLWQLSKHGYEVLADFYDFNV